MSSVMGGYAPPPQPVDRQVTGVMTGAEPRNNGWVRFAIQEQGRQYPVKVDTKKPEVVQQCMALMGQMVTAQVREQQSTSINPHNGQPYTNRYLNEIAPAGYVPQGQPVQEKQMLAGYPLQPQQPQQQPVQVQQSQQLTGAERDLDIHRQLAWKGACWLAAAGVIGSEPRDLVEAAEVGMAYIHYGPLRFGVQPFSADGPSREVVYQLKQEQGGNPNYARVEGMVTADGHPFDDQLPPGQGSPRHETEDACPDCGYIGGEHAYGCPRGPQAFTG